MHDRRREIEERLSRVVDERIQPAIYSKVADLTLEVWHVPLNADGTVGEPVPFEKARSQSYAPAQVGARTTAVVTPHFETTGAREVDLLERPIDQGAWDGHRLAVRPFQIVTLRFAR